jgi:sulfur relay (sulfurtransferase) DsrC/TusE family protein
MDDLLKEAIADAKAVRETALENAKIALEEAFTPRLQSMLSKKIQSEMEVEEGEHEDEEEVDEKMRLKADDEDPTDKDSNEAMHDEDEDEDDVEERMHGEEEDDDVEERMHDEDEDEVEERMHGEEEDDDVDEELDLEAVLKELENEAMHDEDEDDVEEGMHDEDEDEEKVDENDVSSGIGSADNKVDKKAGDSTDIGKAGKAKFESKEQVEEDIDLDEVLKALTEDEDEEEVAEEVNEVEKLQSELDEHRDVVKYLRGKLNEVNLLNAKLLFTNKLFRAYGLSNDQKMKVVETFDRATNLREVKLVYSTLAESFGVNTKKEIKESKGSASKAVASTKSEKQEIISEGSELRDRFKKLAGITKFSI